jgi:cytochrome c oxidase subunit 2
VKRNYILFTLLAGFLVGATLIYRPTTVEAAPPRVEVTAKRFSFEPAEITVKKGEPVDFVLKSADVAHGIRIRELNLDVKVKKGETSEVTFTPDKTGDFVGHCSVFCGAGHGSMKFTIHVVE